VFDPALDEVDFGGEQPAAGRSSGIGAGSMPAAARLDHPGARCRRASAMLWM
jgi:hypothetical protein